MVFFEDVSGSLLVAQDFERDDIANESSDSLHFRVIVGIFLKQKFSPRVKNQ
jgi:hypothetical protein